MIHSSWLVTISSRFTIKAIFSFHLFTLTINALYEINICKIIHFSKKKKVSEGGSWRMNYNSVHVQIALFLSHII